MDVDEDVPVQSGMGRGRGRGGVPVLPAGTRKQNIKRITVLKKRLHPLTAFFFRYSNFICSSTTFHLPFSTAVGIWGALNSSSTSDLLTLETIVEVPKKPTTITVDVSEEIPRSFGGGRGRGFGGRNAGKNAAFMVFLCHFLLISCTFCEVLCENEL